MSSPYGPLLLEHFRRPRNFGGLPSPDAVHEVLNPVCGDRIRMEVMVRGGFIVEIAFRGDACAICIASASLLTEWVRGGEVSHVMALEPDTAMALLEAPVPPTRERCALLPLNALRGALAMLRPAERVGDSCNTDQDAEPPEPAPARRVPRHSAGAPGSENDPVPTASSRERGLCADAVKQEFRELDP